MVWDLAPAVGSWCVSHVPFVSSELENLAQRATLSEDEGENVEEAAPAEKHTEEAAPAEEHNEDEEVVASWIRQAAALPGEDCF